jgi:hypothetical protein
MNDIKDSFVNKTTGGATGWDRKGFWNASTNTPTIPTASPTNKGWYYVVNVAGNTLIDGISEWGIGDWIVSNGVTWEKLDNSEVIILESLLSEVQNEATTNADTFVSPRRFWQGIARFLALAWTFTQKITFSILPRLVGATASQLLGTDANKDVVSIPNTLPTQDQKDALAGEGTPSSSNKYTTKSYVDALATNVRRIIGSIDCSANPNYPTANKGDSYQVSVAGRIGGVSGEVVNVGDEIVCIVTSLSGTEAEVGAVLESNRDVASESVIGVSQFANQTDSENIDNTDINAINNTKSLTLKGLRYAINRLLGFFKFIFAVAPRLSSTTASTLLRVDANKDVASATVRNGVALDASGNLELGGAIANSKSITINAGQSLQIGNFFISTTSISMQIGVYRVEVDSTQVRFTAGNRTYIINNNGSLVELLDYTASYTARSLPAKSYVDALFTSGAVGNNTITNEKLAQVATAIFKGRITAGTGNVEDLTVAQAKTLLAIAQSDVSGLTTALGNKADLVAGLVPANQLPAYVDDVLEFTNLAGFPPTGESGKIYLALDTNQTYRWSGSVYTIVGNSLALGETSSTAYRGDRGKTAYDHSQSTGNPHDTQISDIDNLVTTLGLLQVYAEKNLSNGYAGLDVNGLLTWALIMPDAYSATLPPTFTFESILQVGSYDAPITDLAFPLTYLIGAKRGMTTIIFHKRGDTQVPYFSSDDFKNMGANYVPQALNIIFVKYDGAKCLVTSISEVVLLGASGLSIASTFNFGAYPNFLEGDVLTGQATAVNPSWNWLSATDSAGAGQATLNSLQAYTVIGNENFITFRVKGRQGMFDGQFVTLTPFKPTKAITEDSNWNTDFWFDNTRFTRSVGNTNAPTKITGAGVGFSGNHVSIVSSTTGASKLYIAIGGTVANLPQIPVSAQFYFFEVEIWCNADKDLRFRMDDNELFQEFYQDATYGAAVTPPTFRAFNAVVTKRIIVRNNQNTSNSRFAVETTGTGTTGDEIRVNIKRAGLISA